MTSIGNVGSPNWSGVNSNTNTQSTQNSTAPIGQGSTAPAGAAPPTNSPTSAAPSSVIMAMLGSLHSFMPSVNDDMQDVTLAEVTAALKKLEDTADNNSVNNSSESKKRQLDEKEKKLQDAAKKAEDAANLAHSGNIWDKIKAFFEAVAAVFAIILGAVLDIIPGAGAALIVAGVAGLVLAIDDEVKACTGLGIAGNLDKLAHPNDPASWAKADMGFEMALMGIAIVGTIVGMVTGTGEAQVASMADRFATLAIDLADGADEGSTAMSAATKLDSFAQKLYNLSDKIAEMTEDTAEVSATAQKVQTASRIGEAVGDVGTATGNIVQGVYSDEAANAQAESKQSTAKAKMIEALVAELDALIDQAIHRLAANGDRWAKMIDSVTDAIKDRTDTMSHAKLTA